MLVDQPTCSIGRPRVSSQQALRTLRELARQYGLADLERRCSTAEGQARAGVLNVAVLGRFKAGKTSLLNQLLGAEVLPVQAIPATAVITRVRFGAHLGARVKQEDDEEPFPVDLARLVDWTTETGNPANERDAEWVGVESPALDDLASLVLVDTPGTGSTWRHNTEASLDWLPNAGAAVVAVSATQPLAQDDIELIESLRPHTPNVIVALTKVDLLSDADLTEVRRHVRRQLSERLPSVPPVLPFSIAPADQALRAALRSHLRELQASHAHAVAALAQHRRLQLIAECRTYLEIAKAAATGHQLAVGELRRALDLEAARLPTLRRQAQAELQPANDRINAQVQRTLIAHLSESIQRVTDAMLDQLPGFHASLGTETVRFRQGLRDELIAALSPLAVAATRGLESLMDEGLEPCRRTGEAFVERLGRLVSEATGTDIRLPLPELVRQPFQPADVRVSTVFDSHLELLSWAIPMPLARPLVHRHFLSMVPWQVEKNLYRTGYRVAGSATKSLQRSVDAYLDGLAETLATCRQLIAADREDVGRIDADLGTLNLMDATDPPLCGPGVLL